MYYARVCVFALLSKQENNISYGSCTLDAETLAARQNETRQPMNALEVVSLLAIAAWQAFRVQCVGAICSHRML